MECPVCRQIMKLLFRGKILNRYNVIYFKCNECGLIKTEEPFWLAEAYTEAIADLDVGLVSRNVKLAPRVGRILEKYFDSNGLFLDYAGGYGLFVRMMRDMGFNFFREDKYCKNIFAKYYDVKSCHDESKYELITAFEFLEHVVDPVKEIEELLKRSYSILFTTELQPHSLTNVNDWWYFVPETGQHISFFTYKTLSHISNSLGTKYYTDGKNLHLFTKKNIYGIDLAYNNDCKFLNFHKIKTMLHTFFDKKVLDKPKSLTWSDFQMIKKTIVGNLGSQKNEKEINGCERKP